MPVPLRASAYLRLRACRSLRGTARHWPHCATSQISCALLCPCQAAPARAAIFWS